MSMQLQPKIRITWNQILAEREANHGRDDGLRGAAEMLLEASNQIVPFDKGGLIGSGAVDFDFQEGTASVFYDTVYAAKLHQNPQYNFQNGRRGKWLATAFSQGKSRVIEKFGHGFALRFRRNVTSV